MLQHLAISIDKIKNYELFFNKLKEIVQICLIRKIPVLTLNIPETDFDSLNKVMSLISNWEKIHLEKIKINIFGKWYDLPWRIIDEIKNMINETKSYDGFFLNFCISYDGQEEIVEACKLLSKKVQTEKISSEQISKIDIKEHLYTSAFMPPEKIIILGDKKNIDGFLLWDSSKAEIIFLDENFENINFETIL